MMKTQTENKILDTIKEKKLINEGDSVLVALSGGADSVALLYILHALSEKLNINISAAHVHHGIRGAEADNDALFCESLCKDMNIPFFKKCYDVPGYAKKMHISEETAGRKLRYEFFDEIMRKNGITLTATAHHMNDRVETIMMNLIRGTGLKGLIGIEYKNGKIIRPLLDLNKNEILDYCSSVMTEFCHDSTNDETFYRRNKIRLEIIPEIAKLNPNFEECIIRESNIITDDNDFLDSSACEAYKKAVTEKGIKCDVLIDFHTAVKRRVVRLFMSSKMGGLTDISFSDTEAVLKLCSSCRTGTEIHIGNGYKAVCSYGFTDIVKNREIKEFNYSLIPEIPCVIPEIGKIITIVRSDSDGIKLKLNMDDEIIIRSKQNGDIFYPVGMTGRKKVKDLLIDKKIDKFKRSEIPILTVNSEIASVVGIRNDRRYYKTDGEFILKSEDIRRESFE